MALKPDEILAEFGVNDKVASAIEKTKPVLNEVRTETGAEAWDMVTVLLVHLASLHSSERLDKDVIIYAVVHDVAKRRHARFFFR